MGSRGCPRCGSHNTEGAKAERVYWCRMCRHRWFPCERGRTCRGYRLRLDDATVGPQIIGCPDCGVPDRIARGWPEAYRAMAKALDASKKSQLAIDPSPLPQPP